MGAGYSLLTWAMAIFNIRGAFLFNAEFEDHDHAEHVYAQFVQENAEWEEQPVKSDTVKSMIINIRIKTYTLYVYITYLIRLKANIIYLRKWGLETTKSSYHLEIR